MNSLSPAHLLELISGSYQGPIAYINNNYRYLFVNRYFENWYLKNSEDIAGRLVVDVIGEKRFLEIRSYMERALSGEKVKFITLSYNKNGEQIYFEQIFHPDFSDDGSVLGFIAMAYNISEQVEAKNFALESELRFRSLTEVMPQLVWEADENFQIVWCNQNWTALTGTKIEDNLGNGWLNVIHPEDRLYTLQIWEEAVRLKSSGATEYRVRMTDGSYRWFITRGTPIKDNSGNIIRWIGTATDIQDQKNAKLIAEQERTKIYSLFMQAPFLIIVTKGPEHVIELENVEARKYFKGRELNGRKVREAMHEFKDQGLVQVMDLIYLTGKGVNLSSLPVQILRENCLFKEHYADIFLEPIKDEFGNTTGILCTAVDMTKQIHAMKKVEESEIAFRNYIESMPQMAFIANKNGEMIFFNKRWHNYTGLDFLKSKNWFKESIIHPDDQEMTTKRWDQSIRTGTPYEIELRIRQKNDQYRWYLSRSLPLKDLAGNVHQWVGTLTDIHDKKEIESNQGRLLQILENTSDFIGMADLFGGIYYINDAGKNMIGISEKKDITKIDIRNFIYDEDIKYFEEVIIPTILVEKKWTGDFRIKNIIKNSEIWVHCYVFTTHDERTGEINGFATVSRDLSEIKQRERKLQDALTARDQFLSMVSHELKTPLTSLKLQSQMTLRKLGVNKEISQEKQMSTALQTNHLTGRLNRLIDDMLDVSRIKTGKLKLEKEHNEFVSIIKETLDRMALLIDSKNLSFPQIDAEEEIYGVWDRFRLEQVMSNLISNAIKYGKGSKIDIKVRRVCDQVLMSISDSGMGIPKDDLNRIFDRFERTVHSSEISGLGLGLFISREIVESHGGEIWVESELNKGSTFFISLPLNL